MTAIDVRGLPGSVFASGAARHRELTGWDAAIRQARSTTHRVGFVSIEPGAGSTTLATHVTRVLAARRSEPILAIDVSTDASGLAATLGIPPASPSETRAAARTSADALTGLTERDGIVGLRPVGRPSGSPDVDGGPVGAWLAEAAPITRFFEVCVTDFGVRHPFVDLAACAALCDVLCVVSHAVRSPAELARAIAPAIAELPERPAPVLALVDHARDGDAVARAFAADPWPVVAIPFDAAVRRRRALRSPRTRRALLQLTATVLAAEAVAAR